MSTIVIPLPWTRPPLRANDRRHWRSQHRAFQDALTQAREAVKAANPRPIVGAEATIHWRVPTRRVQDTDNISPSLKPCLDALVAEGILPADNWVHVPHTAQRIHPPEPGKPGAVWVELLVLTEYEAA